ncbi:hypothetical protein [Micromonospora sp. NPDC047134]|uniref:hypothetical protein n=1 Tax=Micromonospora sp. NPDC047134 TaxID=3154340 RepID=UPI003401E07C
MFRTDDGGQAPVNQQALSELLAVAAPQLRLTLVNACWGASLAQLLADTTGCAIGSTTIIDDETARRFSHEFYRATGTASPQETHSGSPASPWPPTTYPINMRWTSSKKPTARPTGSSSSPAPSYRHHHVTPRPSPRP